MMADKSADGHREALSEFAPLPLTEGQLEKWLPTRYDATASLAYNECRMFILHGELDRDAFQRALHHVWKRHEAFRICFAIDGTSWRIEPDVALELEELDFSAAGDEAAATQRFIRHCERHMAQPLDLAKAPLVRASLVRLGPSCHGVEFMGHHLVLDGWSGAVLAGELGRSYSAYATGAEPRLPPAASYRAYVLDEHARRAADPDDTRMNYWKRLYADPPARLELPCDRPPPARPDFSAGSEEHVFPSALIDGLRQRAQALDVTLNSVLLAAFSALLARLSGQHDFAVGMPFARQVHGRFRRMIGDAGTTLPLRMRVQPAMRFAALARAVHAGVHEAIRHPDVGMKSVVAAIGLQSRLDMTPLTGVIFNFLPRPTVSRFHGLECSQRECRRAALMWEMACNFDLDDRALTLQWQYASARFDPGTIRGWIDHLQTLLERVVAEPDIEVAALLAAGEGATVTVPRANDAPSVLIGQPRPVGETLLAMLAGQCRRAPQRTAVEFGDDAMSYQALDRRTDAVAAALIAAGVGRGDRVGVAVPPCEDVPIAVLGVMKAGAAYVPLDPEFPADRLCYMADDARLRFVLTAQDVKLPDAVAHGRTLLALERLPGDAPVPGVLPDVDLEDTAYVIYTSGSTGKPKGVCLRHRNLANLLVGMREQPGLGADDVVCVLTTLSFDIAALELYLPLVCGARMVIANENQRRDPSALLGLLERHGVTLLQTTPSLLRLVVDSDSGGMLSKIRVLVGGEELPRDLAATLAERSREVWNMYGPTETTVWSSTARVENADGPIAIGQPITNTQIHVLDAQQQPTPHGAIGEIWIGGQGVAAGYLFQPELTAARFRVNPAVQGDARLYRTGDLGRIQDGQLYFHGRVDQQIKMRGFRIEPGEIEAAALAQPDVHEAAVVLRNFGRNDQRLVLYAATAAKVTPDRTRSERLRAALRATLPPYMLPQHIEWLERLPQTPNGKIDRKALPPLSATATAPAPDASSDPREQGLIALWTKLIGVEQVRAEDNFFDLGGHSLLAVEMVLQVERRYGVRLSLLDIATSSLRTLAQALPERAAKRQGADRSLRRRMRRVLGSRPSNGKTPP